MTTQFNDKFEQEAAPYGFTKKRVQIDGKVRVYWAITCATCRSEFKAAWPPNLRSNQLVKNMRAKFWTVGRHEAPKCASCNHKREDVKDMANTTERNPLAPPSSTPALPDGRIMRRLMGLLEDNFEEEKHRYREGYDDARIAREAECALEFVVRYRRQAFGEVIVDDPRLTKLAADLDALKSGQDTLAEMVKSQGDAIRAASARLETLRAQLRK
jgi:hypothetical protein